MERRQFGREFKLEAVKLVRERGVTAARAARDLELHENLRGDLSESRRHMVDGDVLRLRHPAVEGAEGDRPRLAGQQQEARIVEGAGELRGLRLDEEGRPVGGEA